MYTGQCVPRIIKEQNDKVKDFARGWREQITRSEFWNAIVTRKKANKKCGGLINRWMEKLDNKH